MSGNGDAQPEVMSVVFGHNCIALAAKAHKHDGGIPGLSLEVVHVNLAGGDQEYHLILEIIKTPMLRGSPALDAKVQEFTQAKQRCVRMQLQHPSPESIRAAWITEAVPAWPFEPGTVLDALGVLSGQQRANGFAVVLNT